MTSIAHRAAHFPAAAAAHSQCPGQTLCNTLRRYSASKESTEALQNLQSLKSLHLDLALVVHRPACGAGIVRQQFVREPCQTTRKAPCLAARYALERASICNARVQAQRASCVRRCAVKVHLHLLHFAVLCSPRTEEAAAGKALV